MRSHGEADDEAKQQQADADRGELKWSVGHCRVL
jgi:hypothetical protein